MFSLDTSQSITTLRLEHGKVNALDLALCQALTAEMKAIATSEARALVVTGAGNAFSAGVDLVQLTQGGADYVKRFLPAMDEFFLAMLTFPKPLIGAVNGHALAGGCIMAACCDHVVMTDGPGLIGVTELAVGVPFPMLPFEITRARLTPRAARDLIFSARGVGTAEALTLGLVDEVVPAADLLTRATAAAERLAKIPAVSFAITKRAFAAPILDRVRSAEAIDADTKQAWQGEEVLSAVRGFLDKRARRSYPPKALDLT